MIIRVKGPEAFIRVQVSLADRLPDLLSVLALKFDVPASGLKLYKQDKTPLLESKDPLSSHLEEGQILLAEYEVKAKPKVEQKEGSPSKKGCSHGPTGKCINCLGYVHQIKQYQREIEFQEYVSEVRKRCEGHKLGQSCNSCVPPQCVRYGQAPTCDRHAPYPKGMCNKCTAPIVTIQPQPYRHVSQVRLQADLRSFSMAVLLGEKDGSLLQVDQAHGIKGVEDVERFKSSCKWVCGLYMRGPIEMSSLLVLARLQQQFGDVGYELIRVSRFVLIVDGADGLECWMASDQLQALVKNDLVRQSSAQECEFSERTKVQYLFKGKRTNVGSLKMLSRRIPLTVVIDSA